MFRRESPLFRLSHSNVKTYGTCNNVQARSTRRHFRDAQCLRSASAGYRNADVNVAVGTVRLLLLDRCQSSTSGNENFKSVLATFCVSRYCYPSVCTRSRVPPCRVSLVRNTALRDEHMFTATFANVISRLYAWPLHA